MFQRGCEPEPDNIRIDEYFGFGECENHRSKYCAVSEQVAGSDKSAPSSSSSIAEYDHFSQARLDARHHSRFRFKIEQNIPRDDVWHSDGCPIEHNQPSVRSVFHSSSSSAYQLTFVLHKMDNAPSTVNFTPDTPVFEATYYIDNKFCLPSNESILYGVAPKSGNVIPGRIESADRARGQRQLVIMRNGRRSISTLDVAA